MITTQHFAAIVGETYDIVRNAYGRPARTPSLPKTDWSHGRRQYEVQDVYAWTIARALCGLGFTWEEAAEVVREQHLGISLFQRENPTEGDFIAVWSFDDGLHTIGIGTVQSIADVIAHDQAKHTVKSVRMLSVASILQTAQEKAALAGYSFEGAEIVAQSDKGAV